MYELCEEFEPKVYQTYNEDKNLIYNNGRSKKMDSGKDAGRQRFIQEVVTAVILCREFGQLSGNI